MSEESLLQSVHSYISQLTQLHSQLTRDPSKSINEQLAILQECIDNEISMQIAKANELVDTKRKAVDTALQKLSDWKHALGESVAENSFLKSTEPLDIRLESVESALDKLKSRLEDRGKQVLLLHEKIAATLDVLEVEFLKIKLGKWEEGWEALDLTSARVEALENELVRCQTEAHNRLNLLNNYIESILSLRIELGIFPDTNLPQAKEPIVGTPQMPISDALDLEIQSHLDAPAGTITPKSAVLLQLQDKMHWLEKERECRNQTIQNIYDDLYYLWTSLGISNEEMDEFVDNHMGSTAASVQAYKDEHSRMLALKRANLSTFIEQEREKIIAYWDSLHYTPEQRESSFPEILIDIQSNPVVNSQTGQEEMVINDNVSEELLSLHERQVAKLEEAYQRVLPILNKVSKYLGLLDELTQLEISAADPNRLKSTRGDPGRLLREEKARKRVNKEKPKLEQELLLLIPEWEEENGDFMIEGGRFLDVLQERVESEAAQKASKKRGKLGASTLSSTLSSTTSNPLKRQNTGGSVLASVKPEPEPNPSKRIARQNTGPGRLVAQKTGTLLPQRTGTIAAQKTGTLVAQKTGGRR